jgi:ABC-type transport system involved in multi-copper enzyme maturation permease subunit
MTLTIHLYRRVLRRGRLIGLLALSSIPALAYWLTALNAEPDEAELIYSTIIATAGFSYAIAVLILTVATLREERDAGTLPYIYMRPISRTFMAASSIAAGMAAALTLALGGWLATFVAALAVGVSPSVTVPGLVQFAAAGIGYAAIFVPLGYLVPRSVLVGLGYIIVVESILAAVVSGLAQISIWRVGLSIFSDVTPYWDQLNAGDMLGPVTPGVGGGLIKLAVIMVIGLATLTWALKRRDAL